MLKIAGASGIEPKSGGSYPLSLLSGCTQQSLSYFIPLISPASLLVLLYVQGDRIELPTNCSTTELPLHLLTNDLHHIHIYHSKDNNFFFCLLFSLSILNIWHASFFPSLQLSLFHRSLYYSSRRRNPAYI